MESRELRLGNYLHEEGEGVIVVESINSYGGEEINEDSATGYIEPIPLTADWLLKFGFTKTNGDIYFAKDDYRISIVPSLQGDMFDFYGYSEDSYTYLASLFFVHQLQNLYFALSGEELTLPYTEGGETI